MNILIVIGALLALLLITHRLHLSAEGSRKLVHLGMGTICLSFPWLFEDPAHVDLLAALAVISLLLLRWLKPKIGDVLHRVQRLSFGELLFPVGVAIVFRLSDGSPSTYLPAIGILTFADTAGALIGRRFGKHHYRTNAGQKSLEGSLAVFLVSFLITWASGIHHDLITALLIATVVALVATMAEGVLGAGIDNLLLPITVYALLFFLNDLTWTELLARIGIIFALGTSLFFVRRLTSLNGGGLLSAIIFGYLSFALGGKEYLIAPITLFLIHLATTRFYPELKKMEHSADSVAAVALPGLIWIALKVTTSIPDAICYQGFCLTILTQVALLHAATQAHLNKPPATFICLIKVTLIALVSSCLHPALLILPVASRFLGSLSRFEQAILAYGFSLIALLS
ncbi:MAG: diacylglycerol/polyprenol kinase family protein [Verrucomicrobiaceae bacterium]